MKFVSIFVFVFFFNVKSVNGICFNEIEKLLLIWIGINDSIIVNVVIIVFFIQILFFFIKKFFFLNKKVIKEEVVFEKF